MNYRVLLALFGAVIWANLANGETAYPQISFVGPGAGKTPVARDQFVVLVVEGPNLSYEKNPVPDKDEVGYVNALLKARGVSYLAVYTREGVKYGDVIKAIDVLRKTDAKNIGVSMIEVPVGREP